MEREIKDSNAAIQLAVAHTTAGDHPILRLQRTAGNQAVLYWLRPHTDQSTSVPQIASTPQATQIAARPDAPQLAARPEAPQIVSRPEPPQIATPPQPQKAGENSRSRLLKQYLPGLISLLAIASFAAYVWYRASIR